MSWELIIFGMALAGVSLGCLLPAGWLPLLPNDKLLHFGAYAGLTLLSLRIAQGWQELGLWVLGLALSGWLIEVLQNMVPGRKFSWGDMVANLAGILAGCCAAPLLLVH